MDMKQHLLRQMAFSRATFGTGNRTEGVSDHIRKELKEIASERPEDRPEEWVDVVLLALDGLWRSIETDSHPNADPSQVAEAALFIIENKQGRNERRIWPDWRTAAPDKAIEHVNPSHTPQEQT